MHRADLRNEPVPTARQVVTGQHDGPTPTAREVVLGHGKESTPIEMSNAEAYDAFVNKVFDMACDMMLPAKRTTLGEHCFRYAAILSSHYFYHGKMPPEY